MRPRTVRQICVLLLVFAASAPQAGVTPINVGNLVWNDVDADGIQDANEPGLGSVTVQLWNDARNQLLDSAVTNAAGHLCAAGAGTGDYRVRVVLPMAGDAFSPKDAAPNDQIDSDINPSGTLIGFTDTYVFASNLISITTIDAGIVRAPIALGDRVWNDYDADGVQDADEPGIAGTAVELWNDTRTLNLLSTTTDATGGYQLQAPGPGSYRIRVAKASQDSYAPKDAGASDLLDSDVNPSGTDHRLHRRACGFGRVDRHRRRHRARDRSMSAISSGTMPIATACRTPASPGFPPWSCNCGIRRATSCWIPPPPTPAASTSCKRPAPATTGCAWCCRRTGRLLAQGLATQRPDRQRHQSDRRDAGLHRRVHLRAEPDQHHHRRWRAHRQHAVCQWLRVAGTVSPIRLDWIPACTGMTPLGAAPLQDHEVLRARLANGTGGYSGVEGDEAAAVMHRQREQVGVGDLPGSMDPIQVDSRIV